MGSRASPLVCMSLEYLWTFSSSVGVAPPPSAAACSAPSCVHVKVEMGLCHKDHEDPRTLFGHLRLYPGGMLSPWAGGGWGTGTVRIGAGHTERGWSSKHRRSAARRAPAPAARRS